MKSIYEFKKGDEIVRIEPAKSYGGFLNGREVRDRSYIGEKLIFHGIANGVIYLKPTDKVSIFLSNDKFIDLKLDIWDEGWNYWVDPESLEENQIPRYIIQEKLDQAIAEENYELADKLEKMLSIRNK